MKNQNTKQNNPPSLKKMLSSEDGILKITKHCQKQLESYNKKTDPELSKLSNIQGIESSENLDNPLIGMVLNGTHQCSEQLTPSKRLIRNHFRIKPKYGCDTQFLRPPFQSVTGFPLKEEIGECADIHCILSPTGPQEFYNFSELSLPNEGKLSVGTAIGKFGDCSEHKYRKKLKIGPLSGRQSFAEANLIIPFIFLEKLVQGTEVKVSIDMTIGDPNKHLYILIPPKNDNHIDNLKSASISGNAQIFFFQSSNFLEELSFDDIAEESFLRHKVDAVDNPTVITDTNIERDFNISANFKVREDTQFVAFGIQVRVLATLTRVGFDENQNNGFSAIDLRDPTSNTQAIHYALEPGGPVSINSFRIDTCRPPVLAKA